MSGKMTTSVLAAQDPAEAVSNAAEEQVGGCALSHMHGPGLIADNPDRRNTSQLLTMAHIHLIKAALRPCAIS